MMADWGHSFDTGQCPLALHVVTRGRRMHAPTSPAACPPRATHAVLPELLGAGVRVMIYAGDRDLICNWVGNRQWVDVLPWSGAERWAAAQEEVWSVDGAAAGTVTAVGPLSFVKVAQAGHMVSGGSGAVARFHSCCAEQAAPQLRLRRAYCATLRPHLPIVSSPPPHRRSPWTSPRMPWT